MDTITLATGYVVESAPDYDPFGWVTEDDYANGLWYDE